MSPRILCISFSDINSDSRVLRQLEILGRYGEVTTLSYGDAPPGSTHHLRIDPALPSLPQTVPGIIALALRKYSTAVFLTPAVRRALELARDLQFDLVVANEARALPLAHRLACGSPVWGDLHEWAPEERAHVRSWRLLIKPFMTWICASYLPRTSALTSVNSSIAKLYASKFSCSVATVRNAGPLRTLKPSAVTPGRIRLVHSGAAIPGRNLEAMIEAVSLLDERFTLDLYLVRGRDNGKYLSALKKLAASSSRIVFHDAVAPDRLPETLNAYDVGVFSLPPRTVNHELMLPNKFFDFVQARLAIVFSPAAETSQIIAEYRLGAVTAGFDAVDLAHTLSGLSESDVERYKANTHAAAAHLSSNRDEVVSREIIERLLHGVESPPTPLPPPQHGDGLV